MGLLPRKQWLFTKNVKRFHSRVVEQSEHGCLCTANRPSFFPEYMRPIRQGFVGFFLLLSIQQKKVTKYWQCFGRSVAHKNRGVRAYVLHICKCSEAPLLYFSWNWRCLISYFFGFNCSALREKCILQTLGISYNYPPLFSHCLVQQHHMALPSSGPGPGKTHGSTNTNLTKFSYFSLIGSILAKRLELKYIFLMEIR